MINIAILTNDLENENEWFFKYIHNYAKDRNITFLRCMVKEYSVIKKEFENIWEYDDTRQSYNQSNKKIDLIWPRFNRIFFKLSCMNQKIPLINNHTLYELARDKWITYENLTLYSPYSTLLSNITDDENLIGNFSWEYVILKPRTGSKWRWIKKVKKDELVNHKIDGNSFFWEYIDTKQIIVQQFVDNSQWIDNITDKIHDIRVVIFWQDIPYIIVRTPEWDDFRCNLAQWGGLFFITMDDLPVYIQEAILHIKESIEEIIDSLNWYYSIDICYSKNDQKVYLIEVNSNIWLWHLQHDNTIRDIYADNILKLIQKKI